MQHCTKLEFLETTVIGAFWLKFLIFWLAIVDNLIRLEQLNTNVELWWLSLDLHKTVFTNDLSIKMHD